MCDVDNSLPCGTRYDEIAIVIGHSVVEGIPVIDGQQCHVGKTYRHMVGIQHLSDETHRVALGTFHKDVGIEYGDSQGIVTTHLTDGLLNSGFAHSGGDPEVLQVVIDKIYGDGVAVVVQCEEGFRQ